MIIIKVGKGLGGQLIKRLNNFKLASGTKLSSFSHLLPNKWPVVRTLDFVDSICQTSQIYFIFLQYIRLYLQSPLPIDFTVTIANLEIIQTTFCKFDAQMVLFTKIVDLLTNFHIFILMATFEIFKIAFNDIGSLLIDFLEIFQLFEHRSILYFFFLDIVLQDFEHFV